jgi:hypothetical protein
VGFNPLVNNHFLLTWRLKKWQKRKQKRKKQLRKRKLQRRKNRQLIISNYHKAITAVALVALFFVHSTVNME